MPVAILIAAVAVALAVFGIVYFAWRIEQDVVDEASKPIVGIGVGVVIVGGGLLLLYSLLRRI